MKSPIDARVRQLALDPQRSFIVQAPAGSGKTELLTRRILTLLCTVEQPEQILAITFTRKAASEMRQRVIEMLDLAARGIEPEDAHDREGFILALKALDSDRRSGWRLLDDPGRLNIRTIDSLATQLAHRLPVTSALGAPVSVLEDAGSLFEEVAEHYIEANYAALQRVLLQLGNKLERARALLAQMLSNRDQWKRHVYAASGRRESLRATLEAMLAELVETRLQQLCAMQPDELESLLVPRLRMAGEFLLQDVSGDTASLDKWKQPWVSIEQLPSAQAQDLHAWQSVADALLTVSGSLRKRFTVKEGFPREDQAKARGCDKSRLKQHKQLMGDVVELVESVPQFRDLLQEVRGLPEPRYSDEQWALLSELLDALPGLLAELQWGFATHRCVDFAEVAQRAQRALGTADEPTDLALAMDMHLRHVLVDEFQDTSQTQFALFEQLIAGWSDQESRTFFAVGDPMQSIYRFREGDVTLFQQATEAGVGPITLEPLTLSVNFRSAPAVIEWVNATFGKIFPPFPDASTGAIPYSPSTAFRQELHGSVHVHPLVGAQENEQALLVARLCREAVEDTPEHQVAILVRSRRHAADILAALREAGLAYQSVDMDPIGDRAVVRDLVALVMALRYPHDRLHWLALLRSPFVGLSLHDLHALMSGCDRHETVFSLSRDRERVSRLGADGQARLQRFSGIIESAVTRAPRTKLMPWVESSWLQLGGPVVCRDLVDLDAAERAMQLLYTLEDEGELWHRGSIERALERLFAAPSAGQDCQIQVMTLHKSKGLEFDTVILPSLERKPGVDDTRLLDWFEGSFNGETQLLLAPFEQSGLKAQQRNGINRLVRQARERCEEEEKKRLLYVACTRARRHLHVIGTLRHNIRGELQTPLPASLLAPLWPVVQDDFRSDAMDPRPQSGDAAENQAELDLERGVVQSPPVRRIALPVEPVRFPVYTPTGKPEPAPEAQVPSIEFSWAGRDARDIGTVVHQQLQLIAASPETLDKLDPQAMAGSIERQLKNLGVALANLEAALTTVLRALDNTLSDPRGRWILARHADARSEWALSVVDEQHAQTASQTVQNVILDRTFVDAEGTRWIIDFKTGDHTGGQIDRFLDNEQKRYADQLERYARVMRNIDHRPIRLALYFPMLKGWREWAFAES